MTSHPCGILHPSKVRKEMGSEPNDVSDIICVSQDWPRIPCGVGALRTHLHCTTECARETPRLEWFELLLRVKTHSHVCRELQHLHSFAAERQN